MNELLKLIGTNKGEKSYRSVVLFVLFLIWQNVQALDKRLAIVESRLSGVATAPARARTNDLVRIGPEWPQRIVKPFTALP